MIIVGTFIQFAKIKLFPMAICNNHLTITHDFLLDSNSKNEPDSQPVPQSRSLDIISRSSTCLKAALRITQPRRGSLCAP